MAYKCLECGHIFEEGEQAVWNESRGEFWGFPCSEEMNGCPICKGDYEKTKKCKICGADFLEDELNGEGVCDECLDEYRSDFVTCYLIGEKEKQEIKINALIASQFTELEIETILYQHIKNNGINIDCGLFIESDKNWFADELVKEVIK